MPLGIPRGARCVQRFNDSRNSAIHITYRISLRSSSMREPRDPLLKVVFYRLGQKPFQWYIRIHSMEFLRRKNIGQQTYNRCTWCEKGQKWFKECTCDDEPP